MYVCQQWEGYYAVDGSFDIRSENKNEQKHSICVYILLSVGSFFPWPNIETEKTDN